MEEVAGKAKAGMSLGTFQEDLCLEKPLQLASPPLLHRAKPQHLSYFNLPFSLVGQGDRKASLHTSTALPNLLLFNKIPHPHSTLNVT